MRQNKCRVDNRRRLICEEETPEVDKRTHFRRSRSDLSAFETNREGAAISRQAHVQAGAFGTVNHVEHLVEDHALDISIVDGQQPVIDLD